MTVPDVVDLYPRCRSDAPCDRNDATRPAPVGSAQMQVTQTPLDGSPSPRRERGPARPRHRVHAGGALQPAPLPRADRRSASEVEVLDPLVDTLDPTPLAAVLADPAIEIVLHAGRQDVAILRREWQTTFTNVFDTQVAAGFAGLLGPGGLQRACCTTCCTIRLPKTGELHALGRPPADRGAARPTPAATSSTCTPLADDIQERLVGRGRPGVGARGVRARSPRPPTSATPTRCGAGCRGRRARPARERAVAQALAGWRERTAAEGGPARGRDRARPDRRRAGQAPADAAPRPRADPRHQARRRAPARRRRDRGDRARPGRPSPIHLEESDRSATEAVDGPTIALAESLVRSRAQEAGLAYELIAARADLSPVVVAARRGQAEPDVRTLQGWRRELVGEELLELLAGRRTLGVGAAAASRSPRPEARRARPRRTSAAGRRVPDAASPPAMIRR